MVSTKFDRAEEVSKVTDFPEVARKSIWSEEGNPNSCPTEGKVDENEGQKQQLLPSLHVVVLAAWRPSLGASPGRSLLASRYGKERKFGGITVREGKREVHVSA